MRGHEFIREYYACFNERRFSAAADMFADDAVIEFHGSGQREVGPEGYVRFADMWVKAFPDARLDITRVEQHGDTICEVDLIGSGTHLGVFDLGLGGMFQPSGRPTRLPFRELLEVRVGRITYSSLSFSLHELIQQLQPHK